MGDRANYAIVEHGRFDLWCSHWGAITVDKDLFWGPEWAVDFIRRQQPTERWLDDLWCDGGAVVDLDRETLVLFGGDDVCGDVRLRRVYLELLRDAWPAWTVRWAHEGVVDVAEYVGVDRASVLRDGWEPVLDPESEPTVEEEWAQSVVTARWEDGRLAVYPMTSMAERLVCYGAHLVDVLRRVDDAPEELVLEPDCTGGLHIDVGARQLDFWLSGPGADARQRARRRWPGWTIDWQLDAFEDHLARSGHRLRFPPRGEIELLDKVLAILAAPDDHMGEALLAIAERLVQDTGKSVDVNQAAVIDERSPVPDDVRRSILGAARQKFLERRR